MKSMKTVAAAVIVAFAVAPAFAADVKDSKIETNIKAEKVQQKASGLASSNTLEAGTIKGGNTDVKNSTVKTTVNVKNVNQNASGLASSNNVKLGNIE